ncbi:MAG: adenylate/guanylate cyclase domain-containing protein [Kiloniellaceae bacterium]
MGPPPQRRTFVWRFASPREAIWPILADTARFNEAAKLPKHTIEEIPQRDGSVRYIGRARRGPFALEWREKPVNWVANRWFEHCRYFRSGPLKSLCATFVLADEGAGSRGEYTIEARPANPLGRLILSTRFFESTARTFGALADDAARFALGESPIPFRYRPPEIPQPVRARVAAMAARIEDSGRGHGLAQRLAEHVMGAQEVDLVHLRPLKLARDWGADPRHVIELCLEAVRAGMLALRWDLLCPRCRIAKAAVAALDQLPRGAHCATCNIPYDADFSKNVELSFSPAPAVRPIEAGEYCLFGPMSTPHIWIHLTLGPGEERRVAADLAPGPYRLRTLEPGPEIDIDWSGGGFPEVIIEADRIRAGAPAEPGEAVLSNRSGRELTAIVEELHWVRDALTADRVTAMQAFRDLFSDQVLRPGDEVSIRRVALMFTDLRGSTALYSDVGDASAYHLVREHFAFLAAIVRAHNGAVVKTIGDAIMAAFGDPADALGAALEVQREVTAFNQGSGGRALVIKLGLHEGPCIAVTLNGRLDYFGSSVNMAARLQAQSRGGDIVLSRAFAEDSAVRPLLDPFEPAEESIDLKGFEERVTFFRLSP